jgi:hypothetical protein
MTTPGMPSLYQQRQPTALTHRYGLKRQVAMTDSIHSIYRCVCATALAHMYLCYLAPLLAYGSNLE